MIKRLWRWISWFIAVVGLLLVALSVGIHVYTQTDQFRSWLRVQILSALNDSLNGEVQLQTITGSLWSGLRFHGVSVNQRGTVVLSAPLITIDVGFLGQLYRFFTSSQIRIADLKISSPEMTLDQDRENHWNVFQLVKSSGKENTAGALTILLSRITIDNGQVEIKTAAGREARLTSLTATGRVDLLPSGVGIDLQKFDLALFSAGFPRAALEGSLSLITAGKAPSLIVKRLNISTPESHLAVTGTVRNLSSPELNLTLDLKKASATELTSFLPSVPLRQDIAAKLQASGPLSALTLSGTVATPDGRIVVSTIGDWSTSKPRVQGNLQFQDFVVNKVLAVPRLKGTVQAQVSFQGSSFETAQASAQGNIHSLVVDQWKIGTVALNGHLKENVLAFSGKLNEEIGKADFRGTIGLSDVPSYEVTLHARSVDLKKIAGRQADLPSTDINVDGLVQGRGTEMDQLQAAARLRFHPSQIADVRIGEGLVEGSLRKSALDLRQVRFVASGSRLNASGTIFSVTQQARGKITYALRLREIKPWLKLAGVDGSGQATIEGTVSGSIATPRLEGNASVAELHVAGRRIEKGAAHWTLGRSAADQWRGKVDVTARHVSAGIPLQSVQAQVMLESSRPAKMVLSLVAWDNEQRVQRLKGGLSYSPERTEMTVQSLTLQLPNGTWRNPQPIHLAMEGKTIQVDKFGLTRGQANFLLEGTSGLEGKQNLSLTLSHFRLSDLQPYLKGGPGLDGTLSVALRVTGTASRPLLDASMSIEKLRVAGQPYAGLTAKGSYQQEQATIDLKLLQDKSHQLSVTGTLPVYLGWGGPRSPAVLGETNLRIHSEGLSPAVLSLATKDVENVKGTLSIDIRVRGPLDALAPNGTIEFHDGAAGIRPLGLSLTDVEIQAALTPSVIRITSIHGRSGKGFLTGSGTFGYKGFTIGNIGLTVNGAQVQVIDTREYKAEATGKLFVSGSLQQPSVRGSVALKGTLRPDLALLKTTGRAAQDNTIVVVQRESDLAKAEKQTKQGGVAENGQNSEASAKQNDFYRRLALDVIATISRDTWVYLDNGSIELTGTLHLIKQPEKNLSMTGEVNGMRGRYSFKGRNFQIEKAQFIFTGGEKIDPRLDIVGQHRVPSYLIQFVVTGYASKPALALRSDPPLDQADVLSVLLFGKPVAALTESEKGNLQSQAAVATADFFAADLERSVADSLGLDILNLDVGNNLASGQIGVGKYIRNDVFVSTQQQIGGEKQQEYSIEYNITPDWQIKSSTSPEGESSIDLFWRKNY
jgi:translocation and assembly module TamB